MKKVVQLLLGLALGFVLVASASAQSVNGVSTSSATNATLTGQNQASNSGVALSNTWNTPSDSDVHNHLSGVTGSNTAVGLGSFSSAFSPDYCGGVAQVGGSVPFVTAAGGKPVLMEPGYACDDHRTAIHAMEFAATFGNAAAKATEMAEIANKRGNAAESQHLREVAASYVTQSQQEATFAVLMECGHSEAARRNSRLAGIQCPLTEEEQAAKEKRQSQLAQQQAVSQNEPTDPFVRERMGLPQLK